MRDIMKPMPWSANAAIPISSAWVRDCDGATAAAMGAVSSIG